MALLFINLMLYHEAVPTTHFPPGTREITHVATQQAINVNTAITGMATPVGNANIPLNIETKNPSQKICIRYIP